MREEPLPESEVGCRLNERLGEIGTWDGAGRLRRVYPVSRPLASSVRTLAEFWDANSNNAGAHLESPESLRGTKRLEREVVADIAALLHLPTAEGWLSTGATESNLTGLWLARERMARLGESRPLVLISPLAHDSVRKACRILRLDSPVEVSLRGMAAMDVDDFASRAAEAEHRSQGLVVVATVGATLTGTCDAVEALAATLPRNVPVHLHVDAAFAGLVLPFSAPERAFDFRVAAVDTLAVDLHKMARLPLGVGVFLARPGLTSHLSAASAYAGVEDRTVLGSRPGALAAAAWAGLNGLGRQGFARTVQRCLALKAGFLQHLGGCRRAIHDPAVCALALVPPAGDWERAERYYFLPHLDEDAVKRLAKEAG